MSLDIDEAIAAIEEDGHTTVLIDQFDNAVDTDGAVSLIINPPTGPAMIVTAFWDHRGLFAQVQGFDSSGEPVTLHMSGEQLHPGGTTIQVPA